MPFPLTKTEIDTPLGMMVAITDANCLYLLQFTDIPKLAHLMHKLQQRLHVPVVEGITPVAAQLKHELSQYFAGTLRTFTIPVKPHGTAFQERTWQALQTVPYGITASYADLARMIYHPTAQRAVGLANGNNNIMLLIPCHRIIRHNGKLGGFGAGIERKKWLLAHEQAISAQLQSL